LERKQILGRLEIESYEETVAKDDLPNESMKTDKAMEFDSNKEISDNVGIDSEVQQSGRQKTKTRLVSGLRNILTDMIWLPQGAYS
jgi:hypothetical protein